MRRALVHHGSVAACSLAPRIGRVCRPAKTRPFRLLASLVAVLMVVPSFANAQFGRRANPDALGAEQILLAPRPLTRLLREGETAIQENRFSDGIEALGTLLLEEAREDLPEDALHQDYFNEPAQDGYYRSSVRGKALRLLGSIPDEGRKILEIQYGLSARQALAAAVTARDMEAISEVTRKYYHTEAGYDASILLAQDKLIRGYPIAAAGILERLNDFPAARKRFGAQLAGEAAGHGCKPAVWIWRFKLWRKPARISPVPRSTWAVGQPRWTTNKIGPSCSVKSIPNKVRWVSATWRVG